MSEADQPVSSKYFALSLYCQNIFISTVEPDGYVIGNSKHKWVRPLQFNYLSYKLFLEKKSCQTQKKKKKISPLVSYRRKWF